MTSRPRMNAKNSSGERVSLLNDETSATNQSSKPVFRSPFAGYATYDLPPMVPSYSNTSHSSHSSPRTPGLSRADSYDSQNTHDPLSPITPLPAMDFERHSQYPEPGYKESQYELRRSFDDHRLHQYQMPPMRPSYDRQTSYPELYDSDSYHGSPSDRGTKRYPCRYRDSHGCEKTFTTSGHASRHSKIHTAEKGVSCTFPGCQKKFTRADNMKQHLETHNKNNKDRSRTSLTRPAGVHKASSPSAAAIGRLSRSPSASGIRPSAEYSPYDPALYASYANDRHPMSMSSAHPQRSPASPYGLTQTLTTRPAAAPVRTSTENSSAG